MRLDHNSWSSTEDWEYAQLQMAIVLLQSACAYFVPSPQLLSHPNKLMINYLCEQDKKGKLDNNPYERIKRNEGFIEVLELDLLESFFKCGKPCTHYSFSDNLLIQIFFIIFLIVKPSSFIVKKPN